MNDNIFMQIYYLFNILSFTELEKFKKLRFKIVGTFWVGNFHVESYNLSEKKPGLQPSLGCKKLGYILFIKVFAIYP